MKHETKQNENSPTTGTTTVAQAEKLLFNATKPKRKSRTYEFEDKELF